MPDLRITVDGSERQVAAGTTAAEVFEGDRSVIAARVGGELRDLAHVRRRRRRGRAGRDRLRRRPGDPAALDRARDGAGRAGAVPGREARHRPADRERLLLRLRRRDAVHPRGPRRASRSGCSRSSRRASRSSRRVVTDDEARAELADEPYKLELIGLKGGDAASAADGADAEVGAAELTIYDNVRTDGALAWKDLCRGPHLPTTRRHPGVQADARRRRLLAGQREEPAAAADLRHRVGDHGRAARRTCTRLEEAEKRDHRKLGAELDLFSFPDEIGSGLAVFHPKGGVIRRVMEDYSGSGTIEAGYEFVEHPAHHQGGAVRDLRAPAVLRRRRCSRRWRWRARTTTSRR